MKQLSSMHDGSFSSPHDARIDEALRAYGRAVPPSGLESRVAARLSNTPATPFRSTRFRTTGPGTTSRFFLWRGLSIGTLAAAAACGIVIGTVRHSQNAALPIAVRGAQSGGLGNARGMHIPTGAIPQSATLDPKTPRTAPHGRATVSRNPGQKPAAAAAPSSPQQ